MKTRTGFSGPNLWENRSASPSGRGSSTGGTDRRGCSSSRREPRGEDAGRLRLASRRPRRRVYPTDTWVKHSSGSAPTTRCRSSLSSSSHSRPARSSPTWARAIRRPSSETAPAEGAAERIETEMERHPWLLRLVRGRLDPATATGLALTLALGLAIVGRSPRRAPRVPHAQQRQARRHRPRGRPVGRRQRDELVDRRARSSSPSSAGTLLRRRRDSSSSRSSSTAASRTTGCRSSS